MPDRMRSRRAFAGCFTLSPDMRQMLRAIRGSIDRAGVYHGSNAEAAALAEMPVDQAKKALEALSHAGMVKLRRNAPASAAAQ